MILSDYTSNEGFTIVVQHRENMASVYRNCYRLLKSVGDRVIAGDAIGTLRNVTDTTGIKRDYLHFELWHRGKPLDPNVYIAF